MRFRVPRTDGKESFIIEDEMYSIEYWYLLDSYHDGAHIDFEIEHTHRTIGFDLEHLINEYIRGLTIDEGFPRQIRKFGFTASMIFFSLIFGVIIVRGLSIISKYVFNSENIAGDVDKVAFFLKNGAILSTVAASTFLVFVAIIVIVALSKRVRGYFGEPRPSFIRISDYHQKKATESLSRFEKRSQKFTMYIIGTLVLTIFSDIVIRYLDKLIYN